MKCAPRSRTCGCIIWSLRCRKCAGIRRLPCHASAGTSNLRGFLLARRSEHPVRPSRFILDRSKMATAPPLGNNLLFLGCDTGESPAKKDSTWQKAGQAAKFAAPRCAEPNLGYYLTPKTPSTTTRYQSTCRLE